MDLIFLVKAPSTFDSTWGTVEPEPEAGVRFKVAEEIFAALPGEPAVNDVAQSVIKAVRKAEGTQAVSRLFHCRSHLGRRDGR